MGVRKNSLKTRQLESLALSLLLLACAELQAGLLFNEKSREKVQLFAKLMELVSESERLRIRKLEELSKNIESLQG
ncbi:hypothetical protein Droror1_Dr00005669 [Drosera rotundifolia]